MATRTFLHVRRKSDSCVMTHVLRRVLLLHHLLLLLMLFHPLLLLLMLILLRVLPLLPLLWCVGDAASCGGSRSYVESRIQKRPSEQKRLLVYDLLRAPRHMPTYASVYHTPSPTATATRTPAGVRALTLVQLWEKRCVCVIDCSCAVSNVGCWELLVRELVEAARARLIATSFLYE